MGGGGGLTIDSRGRAIHNPPPTPDPVWRNLSEPVKDQILGILLNRTASLLSDREARNQIDHIRQH